MSNEKKYISRTTFSEFVNPNSTKYLELKFITGNKSEDVMNTMMKRLQLHGLKPSIPQHEKEKLKLKKWQR